LDIKHRLGALSDAAISHNNLSIYFRKEGRHRDAIWENCCAALLYYLIREQQNLSTTVGNLCIKLSALSPADRRAHWPTAAELFAAHPRLGELLAARDVDQAQAQQVLDRLWGMVAGERDDRG